MKEERWLLVIFFQDFLIIAEVYKKCQQETNELGHASML